jgi:putative Mg2+ transporter-C (MgtC) family protein
MMNWFHEASLTLFRELNDLAEAGNVAKVILRLLVAAILGGVIGFERESVGKSAGLRTHMLVAIGAAIFVMIPDLIGAEKADISQIIQGLVAGVGFLGAGAIIKNGNDTRGLTTAATIWLTAAVGMASGLGREVLAIVSTLLTLAVLAVLPRVASHFQTDATAERPEDNKSSEEGEGSKQMKK